MTLAIKKVLKNAIGYQKGYRGGIAYAIKDYCMAKQKKGYQTIDGQEVIIREAKLSEKKFRRLFEEPKKVGEKIESFDSHLFHHGELDNLSTYIYEFSEMVGHITSFHYAGEECELDNMFGLNLTIYIFTFLYLFPEYTGIKFTGPAIDRKQSPIKNLTKAKLKRILEYFIEDFIKLFDVPLESCRSMALTHVGELLIFLQVSGYRMDYPKIIRGLHKIAAEWKITPTPVCLDKKWEPCIVRAGVMN